jgi:male-specific lethal 3
VGEEFVLKDNLANRKLQRDLAEKSQLQLGAYLYRKERKKRKRLNERKLLLTSENADNEIKPTEQADLEQLEFYNYSSSATESQNDDDRVFLHMGETLKSHLEFDHKMITKENHELKLPADISILEILESFVKSYAMKILTAPQQEQPKQKRRNSILIPGRKEQKVKTIDYDSLAINIDLCKEVADGLRVYFNFTLKDFLLYPVEKEKFDQVTSDEKMKNFNYQPKTDVTLNNFFSKNQEPVANDDENNTSAPERRMSRLRSHSMKAEEDEKIENLSSMASTSSNDSFMPEIKCKGFYSKSWFPLNSGISPVARKMIEETFEWKMLTEDANSEPAMIYGIYHLIRLVVKLPEFLSATPMSEEKMGYLLKYLDAFVEFLEENNDLFGPQNYIKIE